jgi:hypothetical protein
MCRRCSRLREGVRFLPVTEFSRFWTVVLGCVARRPRGAYYVKIANYGTTTESITVTIPNATGLSASAGSTDFDGSVDGGESTFGCSGAAC